MRLLIANRGEIAVRVARTARDIGVPTVAVFSDEDRDALHVRVCDEAVHIGAKLAYLDAEAILEAAARTGATAIHPGYGFLSENAEFARQVQGAGLTWVGPGPDAIAAMGDKVRARRCMQEAGVPVVPGGSDPDEVGFPLLVKAAAGGGGRGMRLVRRREDFDEAVASARREALSAFGSDEVFLERFVERARHVEVQVLGDTHGRVVALWERECSVQRRHQKVIEEAPSAAVTPELRQAICAVAVRAAEAVDYVGAGTVEMLLGEDGEFFFLEMNTRIQVEHPVTEAITGCDLVRLQLEVAVGGHVPEVPPIDGHAIEARLYAEDPAQDYLPQSGPVLDWFVPGDIRVDSGVEKGSVVGVQYDPMLAKLVAHGPTREIARRRLVHALRRMSVLGLKTNRGHLEALLQHPDYVDNRVHTGWLEATAIEEATPLGAHHAVLAFELSKGRSLLPGVPLGWRLSRFRDNELSIGGRIVRWRPSATGFCVDDDTTYRFDTRGPVVSVEGAGVRSSFRVVEVDGGWWVRTPGGEVHLERDPIFPDHEAVQDAGSLAAPMAATVLRVEVEPGDEVAEGDVLVVLEAMKMEQSLRAPRAGRVASVGARLGEVVEAGCVLVHLEEEPMD